MEILKVPFPALGSGQVLVRNYYSVISAGTEGKTVSDARKGYIAKARSRKKEVKMVLDMVKTNGLKQTYDLVMNKLNAPSPLGYSCAGEVIAVGDDINDLKVGDFVACGGGGAVHAEVVSVPRNLCVKVEKSVDLKYAAFATIASIAIQGIRQADLRFGENCVVIGLGLIGQITVQMLEASGIQAIGVDIDDKQVEAAKECGASLALNRKQAGIEQIIKDFTDGNGTDSVIITAGTSSLDPVEFAGEVCRKKGKVVVVGAVPTGFSRPNYYRKELELKMSSSYGPGRYDMDYEEKGRDYPIGYVRFTENRNMKTFIDYLKAGKIDMSKIVSHEFELDEAPEAYTMILERSEPFSGIVIKYDTDKEIATRVKLSDSEYNPEDVNVGFIGAGSFAQNSILPRIKGKVNFIGVATGRGNNARYVADNYGFNYCADNSDDIVNDEKINTVFITTRHNLHAEYVLKSIKAGKNVFVEKPLALTEAEIEEIKAAYDELKEKPRVMLGYNRRFSPHIEKIKKETVGGSPKAINMRMNAGTVPPDHWVHDPEVGGGRIIGEACHFIDLAMYIAGSKITSVSAKKLEDPNGLMDTAVINLNFENGSVAAISYFSNGSKALSKEYIEVFSNNKVYIVDDFLKMREYDSSERESKLSGQDKGHAKELELFVDAIKNGKESPISFEDIYISSIATVKALESMRAGGRNIEI
ncbi:MAG: oxidoreductase [Melioribacteraceae bacterium]|nr:MAG: oxidoreductase [Melioribacteraceae bacterium]